MKSALAIISRLLAGESLGAPGPPGALAAGRHRRHKVAAAILLALGLGLGGALVAISKMVSPSNAPPRKDASSGKAVVSPATSPSEMKDHVFILYDDFEDGQYDGWVVKDPYDPPARARLTPAVVPSPGGHALSGVGRGYSSDGEGAYLIRPFVASNVGELSIEMRAKSGRSRPTHACVMLWSGRDYYRVDDFGEETDAVFRSHVDGKDYHCIHPVDNDWHDFKWTRDAEGQWSLYIDGELRARNFVKDNRLTSFDRAVLVLTRDESLIDWVRITGKPAALRRPDTRPKSPTGADVPDNGKWILVTKIPGSPRHDCGVTVLDGKIYIAGGQDGAGHWYSRLDAYDLATGKWLPDMRAMPTARAGLGLVACSGKLYAIGGSSAYNRRTNVVEEYDPTLNRWSPRKPMPTARMWLGAETLGGAIYAIGGDIVGTGTANVEKYDPGSNCWSAAAPLPVMLAGTGTATVGGALYSVAGSSAHVVDTVRRYGPVANKWTGPVSRTPIDVAHHGTSAADDGCIYVAGGWSDTRGGPVDSFWRYCPGTDAWTDLTSLPEPAAWVDLVWVEGTLYLANGRAGTIHAYVAERTTVPIDVKPGS